jgi:hypothetical protein
LLAGVSGVASLGIAGCTGDTGNGGSRTDTPANLEPELSVESVDVSPDTVVRSHNNTSIKTRISNDGGKSKADIKLRMGGKVTEERNITVPESSEVDIDFSDIESNDINTGSVRCRISVDGHSAYDTLYVANDITSYHENQFKFLETLLEEVYTAHYDVTGMDLDLSNNSINIYYENDGFGNYGRFGSDIDIIIDTLTEILDPDPDTLDELSVIMDMKYEDEVETKEGWWLGRFNFYYEADQDLPDPSTGSGSWNIDIRSVHNAVDDEEMMENAVSKANDTHVRD